MSEYGSIGTIKLYKNIWILIIKYLPEVYWSKIKTSKSFNQLIKELKIKDHAIILAKNGYIESLILSVGYIEGYFRYLCESNILVVKRAFYQSDLSLEQLEEGIISSWKIRDKKIFFFVMEKITNKEFKYDDEQIIYYIRTFLNIFNKINGSYTKILGFALECICDYLAINKRFVKKHPKFSNAVKNTMIKHAKFGNFNKQYYEIFGENIK